MCVCVFLVVVWLSLHDCSYNPDLEERYVPPASTPQKSGERKERRKKKSPLASGPDWKLSSQGT